MNLQLAYDYMSYPQSRKMHLFRKQRSFESIARLPHSRKSQVRGSQGGYSNLRRFDNFAQAMLIREMTNGQIAAWRHIMKVRRPIFTQDSPDGQTRLGPDMPSRRLLRRRNI